MSKLRMKGIEEVYDLCTWSTLDPRATAVGITMSFFGTYQDILLTDLDVGF